MTNIAVIVAGSAVADVRETVYAYVTDLPRPLKQLNDRALKALAFTTGSGIASALLGVATGRLSGLKRYVGGTIISSSGVTLLTVAFEMLMRQSEPRKCDCPACTYYAANQ